MASRKSKRPRKKAKKKTNKKSKRKSKVRRVGKIAGMKLKMDFVSSNVLSSKNGKSRISYILSVVKDGTILVTDGVLTPDEELDLIRETMRRVDTGFPGIEVASLRREMTGYQRVLEQTFEQTKKVRNAFNRMAGRKPSAENLKYGMTLIGPSKLIKEIKKNPDSFSVFAEA
jgi:hypothetical protein